MSFDEYLKLWGKILTDMRVILAIAVLFVLGALLRYIAFGKRGSGGLKRPVLKLLERASSAGKAAAPAARSAEDEDGSDDVGLTEEEYPTEEEEEDDDEEAGPAKSRPRPKGKPKARK